MHTNAPQNRQEQETKLHEYDTRPTGTGRETTRMRRKTDRNPTQNDTNTTLTRHKTIQNDNKGTNPTQNCVSS